MGGGGEYTVYYTVPQAIPGGTLQFDKIARSVNGGKWNTWAMPSTTEANAGSGWWTRDGENYYFQVGRRLRRGGGGELPAQGRRRL